jgi:putative nucleotidyltransferase with HDIG domain
MAAWPPQVERSRSATPPSPEQTLAHLDSLPTLAPVVVELMALTADERSGAADLARVVRADPALTTRVLAVANSAAFGARIEITTLEQAIVRLGFDLIRNLVLAAKIFECFPPDAPGATDRPFERTEFWKHALGVACAARRLAKQAPRLRIDAEQAFLAGLLHDIGKVALDAVFPRAYARALQQAETTRGDIADSERAILGVDHTNAGRQLAQRWRLPSFLRDVIWLHHLSVEALPDQLETPRLISLVQLADTLVREQRIGQSGNYVTHRSSTQLAASLDISEPALAQCAQALVADVADQCALLGLDRGSPETLYLQSLASANSDLSRLNTRLVANNVRLETAARFFRALARFDTMLGPESDLGAVTCAVVAVATEALDQPVLLAFAIHSGDTQMEVAEAEWDDADAPRSSTKRISPELGAWFGSLNPEPAAYSVPIALSGACSAPPVNEELVMLPLRSRDRLIGGILVAGETGGQPRGGEELSALLRTFASAIERTNTYSAAQRLSDDLAASNRRLQHVQTELLRTHTLSMIAEMATGAGHELNSPLAVISGRAQMLRDSSADEQLQRSLDVIHAKAHECSQVVSELMEFARPRAPALVPVDLGELLAAARDDWHESSGLPASRLSANPPPLGAGPVVRGDPDQLRAVFLELLRNATLAVADNDGSISLEWRVLDTQVAAAVTGSFPLSQADSDTCWLELSVLDTGCGMPANVLQRAFDPFFSHRPAGRGRGLGLAKVHRIIQAHGGRIWLESRVGAGTQARIVLPCAQD